MGGKKLGSTEQHLPEELFMESPYLESKIKN